jgi:hypothetical protein
MGLLLNPKEGGRLRTQNAGGVEEEGSLGVLWKP